MSSGCSPEPGELRWLVDFGDVPRDGVVKVAVRILQGSCTPRDGRDAERRRVFVDTLPLDGDEIVVPEGGWMPPVLSGGLHCFIVQARTSECVVPGEGSTEVMLPRESVRVELVASPPSIDPETPSTCGCAGSACSDGECESEAAPACPCDPPERETPETCTNGADDDCDGMTDCDDRVDCPSPPSESSCADTFDEDCDMLVDCDDPDCDTTPLCACTSGGGGCSPTICRMSGDSCLPMREDGACNDDADNDGDGRADCEDDDCLMEACNLEEGTYVGQQGQCRSCATGSRCVELTETFCGDGIDNDCDGAGDCLDTPDCDNRLCGDSYNEWANGRPYGNSRCCPFQERPPEDGCTAFGAGAPVICGSCNPAAVCIGSTTCQNVEDHSAMTHNPSAVCTGCTIDDDCPSGGLDPTGRDRRGYACENNQCYCRYDFACGPNAVCQRSGEKRHCHPRDLNRLPRL